MTAARLRTIRIAAVVVILGLVAAGATWRVTRPGPAVELTVMTRNLYLGGDINRPIAAAGGQTGSAAVLSLANANDELRRVVDRTDFPTRSRLLAREIARTQPDVVGLQEVALWRHGPLQLDQLGVPNADQVDLDFLALLQQSLEREGVRYAVVAEQTGTDVEAPAFTGSPLNQTVADARDVRLTLRDVILVRRDAGLVVTGQGGGHYQARVEVGLGGLPFTVVRGYTWVDLRLPQGPLRVVDTHLESQSADLALAQARELLAGPASGPGATVVLCDCNSDPLRTETRPGDGVPGSSAYQAVVGGGLVDQWLSSPSAPASAVTAVLSETVDDPTPARLDRRIDHVFARSSDKTVVTSVRGEITGVGPADRDPVSGLWASDHAGVVVRLRVDR